MPRFEKRVVTYGLESSADLVARRVQLSGMTSRFEVYHRGDLLGECTLAIPGRHNVVNALAAVAVGREAGLASAEIAVGLAEVDALPLRMQLERWGDVVALVDCYNANPESVLSAAATLSTLAGARRRIAVLGEMLELGAEGPALHEEVGRALAVGGSVDLVVSVGRGAAPIAEGAARAGLRSERFADHESAVRWLVDRLEPGDAVLFKASRGAALEAVVTPVREACLDGAARAR
jgi:UDP-N-acetylmuramyl pentapeptide synthase